MKSGYVPQFLAERSTTTLCLHYLSLEGFEERLNDVARSRFAEEGYFAFQDYAVVHWIDHLLALLNFSETVSSDQPGDDRETSDACIIFGDRYGADLMSPTETEALFPDRDRYATLDCFPTLCTIWRHAKASRAFVDDRRDEVSLLSLRRSFKDNRKMVEDLFRTFKDNGEKMVTLNNLYGTKWFKCSRLSCYYFHEGFDSESSRKDHYNRHERPFRCDEEDCLAAVIGFGSLKELEEHKRSMHPGIDKLSATFARLKKGRNSKVEIAKYPCPRCSERFATRLECRVHMSIHNPKLKAKSPGSLG